MSDINENPQTENDENVVYEYVELEDGQELPEGYEYEYEYVEVPEGGQEISELDVVSQKVEDVPSEEEELASAAEIEAVLSPRNPEEIEKEDVVVPVQDPLTEPEVATAPISVSDEPKMPQIDAPGSGVDLDALLDDVQEPKLEAPQSDVIAEGIPQFEIATPEPEKEEGIPSLDSLLKIEEPEVSDDNNVQESLPRESVTVVNEESAFVSPDNIKFQNGDDDSVKTDWFDESHLKSGAEVGSVDIDDIINTAPEKTVVEVGSAENQSLQPDFVKVETPPAEDASMSDLADMLSQMKAEIKEQENTSSATVISEEMTESAAVEDVIVPTLVEGEIPVADDEAASVENVVEASNDFSLDELLGETQDVDVLAETETVTETVPPVEPLLSSSSEPEEIGIPAIGEIFSTSDEPLTSEQTESIVPVEETLQVEPEPVIESAHEELEAVSEVGYTEQVVGEEDIPIKAEPVAEEQAVIVEPVPVVEETAEAVSVAAIPVAADLIHSSNEIEDIINPSFDFPTITDCSKDLFAAKALAARLVGKNDGIQSFSGTEAVNVLALNDVDFETNELNSWNLVVFKQEIIPLTAKVSELDLPRNPQVNRFASLVKAGEQKAEFFNEDKLKIVNTTDSCVAVQGRFVCGDLQTNSGLIINDMITFPLRDFAGKELAFAKPVSGLLSGPNGALLYFFNLCSILVPNSEMAKIDAEKLQYKISKWYSGTLNDKYFEFNALSPSASFEGNDEIKAIHVNVNNSSYGWNVAFDNGLSMNLRDLREYQTRFGKMPSPNGVISYGQTKLTFSKVERIVVYESAQYFFYS